MLVTLGLSTPQAANQHGLAKWEPEIRAFEASDRTNPPAKHAILFVGSSSIRLWKTLAKDFPNARVINRGFGGSRIADSTAFADRIIFPYEPRTIVFYAGDNDLAEGRTPEQVAADYQAFVCKNHPGQIARNAHSIYFNQTEPVAVASSRQDRIREPADCGDEGRRTGVY